jgi:hypothetical protein
VSASASTTTVTLTFSEPVVVSGPVALTVSAGGPVVSQSQTSPTTYVLIYTSTVAGATYSVPANIGRTFAGGGTLSTSGTF